MSTTSFYTPINKKEKKTDILLWFSRLFVGLLFIFSGLIKANDPMGFGYKLQEYFHVFQLDFLNDYSTSIAVIICAFEIIMGVLLLFGIAANLVAWGLLLLILFFTFLTFYSAFFEVVTSCGCFGDAIPLTPWESFIKDLILLAFILVIFIKRNKINPLLNNSFGNNVVVLLTILGSFGIGIYTVKYLPFIDFLPYKIGNHIPSLMKVPEGAALDEYEIIYTLKNTSTGESKTINDKEYIESKIWEDANWEIVGEPTSKLIKAGYKLPIPDLMITDADGEDHTENIITNPYYNFVVTSLDVNKMNVDDMVALDRINQTIKDISLSYNLRAVLLTASAATDVEIVNNQLDLITETFFADLVPLKSMVRSNPGVILMRDGIVINKWSQNSFPTKEELIKNYFEEK